MPSASPASDKTTWWRALLNRRMLICVFTGFASGLPLYILISLLPAWLKTEGLGLAVIGGFALIQFPYTWKFLWAPLADRYAFTRLGRRRSWMLLAQLGVLACVWSLGLLSPRGDLRSVVAITVALALLGATLDIALDAYRRELLPEAELGLGNAVHVNAYKIAGLVPGSLSLILADHLPWDFVFAITAAFTLPGILMALLVSEPRAECGAPKTLREAVTEPFHEFLTRSGWRDALLVLGFVFLYKLGDSMCTALARRSTWRWDSPSPRSDSSPSTRGCGRACSADCSAVCGWCAWASTARSGSSASCNSCRSSASPGSRRAVRWSPLRAGTSARSPA
jgi:PAT family beta-lactamase induction signal transducer AmpG